MPLQICRLLIVFSSRYILEIFADFGFKHSYYLGANRFNMRPYSYDLRLLFTTHAWCLLSGGNKSADGKISTRSYENFYWFYYKRYRKDVWVKYNKRIINVCYRHDCWVELKDGWKFKLMLKCIVGTSKFVMRGISSYLRFSGVRSRTFGKRAYVVCTFQQTSFSTVESG